MCCFRLEGDPLELALPIHGRGAAAPGHSPWPGKSCWAVMAPEPRRPCTCSQLSSWRLPGCILCLGSAEGGVTGGKCHSAHELWDAWSSWRRADFLILFELWYVYRRTCSLSHSAMNCCISVYPCVLWGLGKNTVLDLFLWQWSLWVIKIIFISLCLGMNMINLLKSPLLLGLVCPLEICLPS